MGACDHLEIGGGTAAMQQHVRGGTTIAMSFMAYAVILCTLVVRLKVVWVTYSSSHFPTPLRHPRTSTLLSLSSRSFNQRSGLHEVAVGVRWLNEAVWDGVVAALVIRMLQHLVWVCKVLTRVGDALVTIWPR
jgi:hypothetical protein